MAIASVLLGVVALLMMFGGIFLSWLPIVGSVLSFGAPVVSLVGIVLGGLAMSRAKQEGNPSGAALAGVIVNVLAFLFGLLVAMTCGLCNACFSTAMIQGRNYDGGPNGVHFQFGLDGGWPGIDEGPGMGTGLSQPAQSGAPPPAMPPPAMPSEPPPH